MPLTDWQRSSGAVLCCQPKERKGIWKVGAMGARVEGGREGGVNTTFFQIGDSKGNDFALVCVDPGWLLSGPHVYVVVISLVMSSNDY